MKLRDYQLTAQSEIFRALADSRDALCVLYTGAGKTEIFISIMRTMLERKPTLRICVLLNKVKLLEQTLKRVQDVLPNVSVYCGTLIEKSLVENIVIATIQSIHKAESHFDLIIADECHRISEQYLNFFDICIKNNPKVKIAGFTATPYINNELIYGPHKLFKRISYQLPVTYGISNGWLVKPVLQSSAEEFDTSNLRTVMGDFDKHEVNLLVCNEEKSDYQVVDALNKSISRKKIIWFCASIKHAEIISSLLTKYGEDNCTYHSEMNYDERKAAEIKFETTECRHLVFITIIAEGYDYPPIDCLVMLRPTKSPTLYVQVVGRTLRTYQGKKDSLVLDYAQVVKNCGPIDSPYVSKKDKISAELDPKRTLKLCPNCRTYNEPRAPRCFNCDYEWPIAPKLQDRPELRGLLSSDNKETITGISRVTLSDHTSKAGNKCKRIDYHYHGDADKYRIAFPLVISEFFAVHSKFAFKKFLDRAYKLELVYTNADLQHVERAEGPKIPTKLFIEYDGKYKKVMGFEFDTI